MVYELMQVEGRGTPNKLYLFRDLNGNELVLNSKLIKENWEGNQFLGVKLDGLGRLIEDTTYKFKGGTPQKLIKIGGGINIEGLRIYTGNDLQSYVDSINYPHERDAVAELMDKLKNYTYFRVCVIKGIRRTGKTTVIAQTIKRLLASGVPSKSIGLIAVSMTGQVHAETVVRLIYESNWEYIFVDEVTHLIGILDKLKELSDHEAARKRIILTGTDSYVWPVALRDVLYGRVIPVDLTYMGLEEYCRVFPDRVQGLSKAEIVSNFCRFGGVLDAREYAGEAMTYQSINTALVGNIVGTIVRNKNHYILKDHVGVLYDVPTIKLVEGVLIAILEASRTQAGELFKTQGIKIPEMVARIMDKQAAVKSEGLSNEVVNRLMEALIELGVFSRVGNFSKKVSGITPDSKMLLVCNVSSLYTSMVETIVRDGVITGEALENLILSQVVQYADLLSKQYIENFKFGNMQVGYSRYKLTTDSLKTFGESNKTPEVDLIVKSMDERGSLVTTAIEIKKSIRADSKHAKNLCLKSLTATVGDVDRRLVVYMGDTIRYGTVTYVNAMDFLMDMGKWLR